MNQRDKLVLKKIIIFCERIADNLRQCCGYEAFEKNHMCQDACCMCIVQIGELVEVLSEEAKVSCTNVPWRLIKDTRNFYVHNYGAIELDKLWGTLNEDIPPLYSECKKMLGI